MLPVSSPEARLKSCLSSLACRCIVLQCPTRGYPPPLPCYNKSYRLSAALVVSTERGHYAVPLWFPKRGTTLCPCAFQEGQYAPSLWFPGGGHHAVPLWFPGGAPCGAIVVSRRDTTRRPCFREGHCVPAVPFMKTMDAYGLRRLETCSPWGSAYGHLCFSRPHWQ